MGQVLYYRQGPKAKGTLNRVGLEGVGLASGVRPSVLEVTDLRVTFPTPRGPFVAVDAVEEDAAGFDPSGRLDQSHERQRDGGLARP